MSRCFRQCRRVNVVALLLLSPRCRCCCSVVVAIVVVASSRSSSRRCCCCCRGRHRRGCHRGVTTALPCSSPLPWRWPSRSSTLPCRCGHRVVIRHCCRCRRHRCAVVLPLVPITPASHVGGQAACLTLPRVLLLHLICAAWAGGRMDRSAREARVRARMDGQRGCTGHAEREVRTSRHAMWWHAGLRRVGVVVRTGRVRAGVRARRVCGHGGRVGTAGVWARRAWGHAWGRANRPGRVSR